MFSSILLIDPSKSSILGFTLGSAQGFCLLKHYHQVFSTGVMFGLYMFVTNVNSFIYYPMASQISRQVYLHMQMSSLTCGVYMYSSSL